MSPGPSLVFPDSSSLTGGIQEALDALGESGGRVTLAAGIFEIQKTVLLPNHAILEGAGAATVLRLAAGAGRPGEETHVLANADQETGRHITVRDLAIEGNHAAQLWQEKDLGGGGIAINGADHVTLEHLRVSGVWRHGIWFLNGAGARIVDCDVATVGSSCISIGGQHHFRRFAEDVLIRGCNVREAIRGLGRKAGSNGIEVKDHSRRVRIADCSSREIRDGHAFAFYVHAGKHPLQAVSDILVSHCIASHSRHGIVITSGGDFPLSGFVVHGCLCADNRSHGIFLRAVNGGTLSHVRIVGCLFSGNGESDIGFEGGGISDVITTGMPA